MWWCSTTRRDRTDSADLLPPACHLALLEAVVVRPNRYGTVGRSLSASAFLEQRVVVSASSLFYLLPSAHMRAVTGLFLFKLNNGRRCVEAWRGV